MTTNDTVDPTVQEARRRDAKPSLRSRAELLTHKLTDAGHRLDLHAQIARHPLPAVGIAFAVGALLGMRRSGGAMPPGSGHSVRGGAFTALAALGLHLVREVALGQLAQVARQWWSDASGGSASEVADPRTADLEPFLEH